MGQGLKFWGVMQAGVSDTHATDRYSGYGSPYNRFGMNAGPNQPGPEEMNTSLSQRMEQQTQAAFMVLDNIVGAFTGFSQMLESTFHGKSVSQM